MGWSAGPTPETPRIGPPAGAEVDAGAELGRPALLLPSLLRRGLEANDRAKYLLSLLQAARAHADAPPSPWTSLSEERRVAGLDAPELDSVVGRSRVEGPDLYLIPGAGRIHRLLVEAVGDMVAPLHVADAASPVGTGRLEALVVKAPQLGADLIPGAYIDQLTAARRDQGDSMHLLVMDAHRGLVRLQARIATESVDGAAVYDLGPGDGELVSAFMAGVHQTSALKLDHPGLGTSATRAADRLLIQNDLGTTEGHVIVAAVEGSEVTLTYTDVHLRRLLFFSSLFDGFEMRWSHRGSRSSIPSLGDHLLTAGSYRAPDRGAMETFLRYLGSRLVFVLDWNRARKRLGTFLPTKDAIAVLRWAADSNVGHMAFLALGGERLVYDAFELAARVPARYGEPLIEVLGRDATLEVTRFALRASTEGMLGGKSALLIRDELRVEVLRHVQASHSLLLDASAEHASLVVECAHALHSALVRLAGADGAAYVGRAARRAAGFEHRADEILTGLRQAGRRVRGSEAVIALTEQADDAIDDLEEAAFLLTLLPAPATGTVRTILEPVAATAAMISREHLKAVEIARHIFDGSAPEDMEDFLVAVDRVATLEHEADKSDRTARAALVGEAPDFRSLYLAAGVARGAEDASDALLRSALGLRDHVLNVLSQ